MIPLLFENNQYQTSIHKILLIDCDEQLQIARAIARSHLSQSEAQAILDAQVSRTTRLKLADEVIENNGTLAELTESVEKMHQKLAKICH